MKKIVLVLVLVVISASISPVNIFAKTRRPSPSPRPTASVDTNDRISVVHLSSITVNLAATQKSQEYQVTASTRITINGQPGALNGLAVGMDVKVTTAPNSPTTAATIEATTAKH